MGVPMAMMGFGVGMETVGAFTSASTQKASLNSQSRIAQINADIAEMQVQNARIQGRNEVMRHTLKARHLQGQQRASMAANGVDIGVGSAAELRASTAAMAEIDKNTIEANALRTAWGYKFQKQDYLNQSMMAKANAKAISPGMSAFSTFLSGASKVALAGYMSGAFGKTDINIPGKSTNVGIDRNVDLGGFGGTRSGYGLDTGVGFDGLGGTRSGLGVRGSLSEPTMLFLSQWR
ncbi:MAG: hypothetical protein LBK01_06705 [Burkholderiaceae bacterium]|jgi:hypothetical protein|nr:hypothetical protein [Burkholderiaceae bacterium]